MPLLNFKGESEMPTVLQLIIISLSIFALLGSMFIGFFKKDYRTAWALCATSYFLSLVVL